jgi:hypothetical protein
MSQRRYVHARTTARTSCSAAEAAQAIRELLDRVRLLRWMRDGVPGAVHELEIVLG